MACEGSVARRPRNRLGTARPPPQEARTLTTLALARLGLESSCGPTGQKSVVCEAVYRASGNSALARLGDSAASHGLRILVVVVLALVANRLAWRLVRRLVESMTTGSRVRRRFRERAARGPSPSGPSSGNDGPSNPPVSPVAPVPGDARRTQRAQAVGTLLHSAAGVLIWAMAVISILDQLGIDVAPLIAGAGIAGVAIGFGAQNLVKDLLTGVFMLLEDQYGVGDVVDVGPASGVVEGVGLRSTKVRDGNGTLWHVPNGQINRVGNKSQQWARAVVDVAVAWDTDLSRVRDLLVKVAGEVVAANPDDALEPPEVLGIEQFGPAGVVFRVQVKTRPAGQWAMARRLRNATKAALDGAGIAPPTVAAIDP